MTAITVRVATIADVPAMSRVLIASITELCAADHGGDDARIAQWTANKTPSAVEAMIVAPDAAFYVAELEGEVAGVGNIRPDGVIGLNYVSPLFRFRGVSRALLSHLEAALRDRGAVDGRLESTRTAHRFYLAQGWEDLPGEDHTLQMRKTLSR